MLGLPVYIEDYKTLEPTLSQHRQELTKLCLAVAWDILP